MKNWITILAALAALAAVGCGKGEPKPDATKAQEQDAVVKQRLQGIEDNPNLADGTKARAKIGARYGDIQGR